jgi:8-oxo-dGTP pyrophosphatase MutT (NUDIX family)
MMRPGGQQRIPRPENWERIERPPWKDIDPGPLRSFDHVVERLSAHSPTALDTEAALRARPSAVLVTLHPSVDGVEVVLTKRTSHLKNHRGEISFPGGRVEPDETVREAALREAEEEVALPAEHVEIVGELDHLLTVVSASYIVPVVATLQARPSLSPSPNEVDRILHVPLHELVRPDTFAQEWWQTPYGEMNVYMYHLDDETIWGATARVLTQVLLLSLDV